MERPKFYVDFNEALDANLVLFSREDTKVDAKGNLIALHEGLEIAVFMDDYNSETKASDFLVATGVVESNSSGGWGAEVKWCCRIDANGVRHESDI